MNHPNETPAQKKARKLACALRTLALYRDDVVKLVGEQPLGDIEQALNELREEASR